MALSALECLLLLPGGRLRLRLHELMDSWSSFSLLRWSLPCRWVLRVSWQGAVTWHSQHWNVSFSSQERWDCGDLLLVLEEVHLDDDLKLDG